MKSALVIIKQTVVRGSGRNTKYTKVPTGKEARDLRDLGYDAEIINIAPRGGVWGETLQVPARQAEKAKRALAGEKIYVTRAVERKAKAMAKSRQIEAREIEENVTSTYELMLDSDSGGIKIMAKNFKAISSYVWQREGAHMVPNGFGDGMMNLFIVKVRDIKRRFSSIPPNLMAEASGLIKVFNYDCGQEWFEIQSVEPVYIYSSHGDSFIVGTDFTCPMLESASN